LSPARPYIFQIIPSNFNSSHPENSYRFSQEGEGRPLSSSSAHPSLSLEVWDLDNNRRLDSQDRYFYLTSDRGGVGISAELGLRLLNHVLNPQVLERDHQGIEIRSGALSDPPSLTEEIGVLSEIPHFPTSLRQELETSPLPFWEREGHLDLDILEGLRSYRSDENQPYLGWQGLGIYLDSRYVRRQMTVTILVAAGFMAGEHLTNSTFMWQTYTTNFLSSIAGSFQHQPEWHETLRRGQALSLSSNFSTSERRLANLRMAEARTRIAQDHLYWVFMSPIVLGACLADQNFRHLLRNPSIFPRYFSNQFQTSLSSLGRGPGAWLRNPLGLGIASLAGFGIYEVSSTWFDLYGGLRQGSLSNQIFSGGASFLVEIALLARVSRELEAITGSGSLTAANLRTALSLRPQWGVLAEIPEGSWLARYWSSSPRLQAIAGRSYFPTVQIGGELGPTAFLNRIGVPRVYLEARFAPLTRSFPALIEAEGMTVARTLDAESILARSALSGEALATAESETVLLAEEILAARRVRLVGLPLLAVALGVGIAMGGGYLTHYFDEDHGPRDRLREWIGR
jgi:hypothetical protein